MARFVTQLALGLFGWAAVAPLCAGADPGAIRFMPHRAYYAVDLIDAKPGTGITSLDGEMIAEWDQTCDGWTMSQTSVLNVYDAAGNKRAELDLIITTWELRDGTEYRFSVRNAANGRETDTIEGVARMPADGSAGWAEFTAPETRRVALPAGTLFPTRHTIVVMNRMAEAPMTILLVFDGLTEQGLHEVNAVIAPELKNGSPLPELARHRSWPVQLAFFEPDARAPEPEHEIGLRLFDNGVGDRMTIDFDAFRVRADLARLEYRHAPSCN